MLPPAAESRILDRLDSIEGDNEHALLAVSHSEMTTTTTTQLSFLNSASAGVAPSLYNSFTPSMGIRVATASGLNPLSNLNYNPSIQGFVPPNGGYGVSPTSRLAMYGLSLQPSEVNWSTFLVNCISLTILSC